MKIKNTVVQQLYLNIFGPEKEDEHNPQENYESETVIDFGYFDKKYELKIKNEVEFSINHVKSPIIPLLNSAELLSKSHPNNDNDCDALSNLNCSYIKKDYLNSKENHSLPLKLKPSVIDLSGRTKVYFFERYILFFERKKNFL